MFHCGSAFRRVESWMGGPNAPGGDNDPGEYGIEGTAAAANNPPSRNDARVAVDPAGKLWLFGGYGLQAGPGAFDDGPGVFNDLWRFDPATDQWTWMSGSQGPDGAGTYGTQGVAAPGNVPPARAATFLWIDSDRNLFLFGGDGVNGAENDLWKFAGAGLP